MKKYIILVVMALGAFTTQAQADSVSVTVEVNEMTDETSYRVTDALYLGEDSHIQPYIVSGGITTLIFSTESLGRCYENSTLIIKFVDGTKIKGTSWNKFSCSSSYFRLLSSTREKLRTVAVEKIYFMNGYSYESETFEIDNQRYFIQLFNSMQELGIDKN